MDFRIPDSGGGERMVEVPRAYRETKYSCPITVQEAIHRQQPEEAINRLVEE
jgi:hypothetical protein